MQLPVAWHPLSIRINLFNFCCAFLILLQLQNFFPLLCSSIFGSSENALNGRSMVASKFTTSEQGRATCRSRDKCGPRREIFWPAETIPNVDRDLIFGGLGRQTYRLYLGKTDFYKKYSHRKFQKNVALKVLISKRKVFTAIFINTATSHWFEAYLCVALFVSFLSLFVSTFWQHFDILQSVPVQKYYREKERKRLYKILHYH